MTSKQYFTFLRQFLFGGALFMLGEAVYHFSGVRTAGMNNVWPADAAAFVNLFLYLWASAAFAFSVVLFYAQGHIDPLKPFLKLLTIPAIVHALVLIYLSLTPYAKILPLPNMYVWISFYAIWVRIEAATLLAYAAYIGYGTWKKFL